MKVEIYSDIACPWCYIGKHRFEAALAEFSGREDVEVVMRPFQLDATLSPDPARAIDSSEHYARKFGPQFKQMQARVVQVAKDIGIDYQAESVRVTNTLDGHRLIWLAEQEGGSALQARVAEGLFKAYFTDGRVVSDTATLLDVAAEAGMDRGRVREFLASDAGTAEVRAQIQTAQAHGISSVPTFVFQGQWGVSGAQEVETFKQVLSSVAQNLEAGATPHGHACDDDGCTI